MIEALGVTLGGVATLLLTGIALAMAGVDLTIAIAFGQLGLVAVPLLAMRITRRDIRVLGLVRPRLRYVVAAVLIGTCAWYLNMHLVAMLPFDIDDAPFQRIVDAPSLVVVLAAIAVAPAVCEEILFRGVLLRGLASRLHAWVAIVVAAMMFSVYHMNPIQMVPTLTLGIVLGIVAYRGRSVIPTMIAHALNNAIALMVARGELPALASADGTGFIDRHPRFVLILAAALTLVGLYLALFEAPDPARGRT